MFIVQRDYDDYQNKTFRIPTMLVKKLEQIANKNNISLNKLVIQALEYSLSELDDSSK